MEIVEADVPCDHAILQESGGHRMQRWDKRGNRVHSSTATVFVRPVEEGFAVPVLDRKDLAWDWHSGTGPGGQNKNKTKNALRLTHRPTGITVSDQRRDRHETEAAALSELQARVAQAWRVEAQGKQAQERRSAVGSGAKADKRRTYRERDDAVSDHASGATARLRDVLVGDFRALWR